METCNTCRCTYCKRMTKAQMIAQLEINMAVKHGAHLSYQSHMRDSVAHVKTMLETSSRIAELVTEARKIIDTYSQEEKLFFGIWGDEPPSYTAARSMLSDADKLEETFYRK